MPAARLLVALGVVVAAVVLFVVLRPGDDEGPAPAATPPVAEPVETGTEPAETVTEPAEEPEPAEPELPTLSIVIRNGLPEGGIQRITVRRDDEVRVVVRSDAPDELHLHGYDIERAVGPGAPAQMRFRATVAGVFELETHRRHVVIGELEVRP